MSSPPPAKKGRRARRRENTLKYHLDRFEARRKRYILLRLWKFTELAEERSKQAEPLLKVINEETSAPPGVLTSDGEAEPVLARPNTLTGEGLAKGDFVDEDMLHLPTVSPNELHAAIDDRPEPGLNCDEDGVTALKCGVCTMVRPKTDFRKAEKRPGFKKCIKSDETVTCGLCTVTAHRIRFSKNQYSLARNGDGGWCLACQKWTAKCDENPDKPPSPPLGADMDRDEAEK
ncbi:hypothetical protein B7463_g9228, partial [Scytalidium lignicola]